MDKNEVVEILKELPERIAAVIMPSDRFFDYKGALSYAISHLEADRWISVKERLPEDYTRVLITNEYGIVTCITWSTWYQNEYRDARKEYKAIAWKPLPKPYESEDK